jgi:hypothetical protein
MYHLRRVTIIAILVVASWFALGALYNYLNPNDHLSDEEREDAEWIASSKYWLDRQSCRWLGLCGLAHWHPDPAAKPWNKKRAGELWEDANMVNGGKPLIPPIWQEIPGQGERIRPGDWDGSPQVLKEIPQFVLDNAPLIHLYSGEQFWPSDMRDHLNYLEPYENFTKIDFGKRVNLENMHELNHGRRGRDLFMQSKEDVEDRPDWLSSAYNKPIPYDDDPEEVEDINDMEYTESSSGETPSQEDLETWFDPEGPQHKKVVEPLTPSFRTQPSRYSKTNPIRKRNQSSGIQPALPKPGGYSPAPAVLVVVDKGQGIIDAFWFYFYSYNLGTTVLGIRFGNHVGDWEHSLIRFHNGVPKAIFFSAHSGGIAYSHKAVEKGKGPGREGRPVLYSALGSHAMYAQPGSHPYVLPFGMLADVTDRGPLWDPAQNYLAYHYNTSITHDVDARSALSTGALTEAHHVSFQPAADNPKAEVGWWWFNGQWGDKFYKLSDRRQWRFAGQYHYVNGPLGPRFKNLGRSRVCQSRGSCTIVDSLTEGKKRSWVG